MEEQQPMRMVVIAKMSILKRSVSASFFHNQCLIAQIHVHSLSNSTGTDADNIEEIDTRTMKVDSVAEVCTPLQHDNRVKYVIDSSVMRNILDIHRSRTRSFNAKEFLGRFHQKRS